MLYEKIVKPLLFKLPAETAHDLGMLALRSGMSIPGASHLVCGSYRPSESISSECFGLRFDSPIGVAAGFDKNARVVNQLAALGFGFVEVGTVTYEPQPGNPKPRMFRLPEDGALINRLGFNNDGAEAMASRLEGLRRKCILGVNIGKNKDVPNEEALENYLETLDLVHRHADYLTVNVSSPNTPNLRELQRPEQLAELLGGLMKRNRELGAKPLLVKIAPDLDDSQLSAMCEVALETEVSGIVATNTTMSREGLLRDPGEAGGLSGRPLRSRSSEIIRAVYRRVRGRIPVVGVGGIFSAEDAFEKVVSGASLIQVYTGLVYTGPRIAVEIGDGLTELVDKKGLKRLSEAVGAEA